MFSDNKNNQTTVSVYADPVTFPLCTNMDKIHSKRRHKPPEALEEIDTGTTSTSRKSSDADP